MTEVKLPQSLVDFSDALKKLYQSSEDATEIVTKWDEITNTDTPATVKVTISGVVHEVDNLAKIRQDLVEGLSLDNPTVSSVSFKSGPPYTSEGKQESTSWYCTGVAPQSSGIYPYEDVDTVVGEFRNVYNDFRTLCLLNKATLDVNMLQLPGVVLLSAPSVEGQTRLDSFELTIRAPSASYATQGKMTLERHYYTRVTFINTNTTVPVTLNLYNATGSVVIPSPRVIPSLKAVTYLVFAKPSQNTVNVQEVAYDIATSGIEGA